MEGIQGTFLPKTQDKSVAFLETRILESVLEEDGTSVSSISLDVFMSSAVENEFNVVVAVDLFKDADEDTCRDILQKILISLKSEGHFAFEETCNLTNAPNGRVPAFFDVLLDSAVQQGAEGSSGFHLQRRVSLNVKAPETEPYSRRLAWLANKSSIHVEEDSQFKNFQQFLDQQQYSKMGILRYEKIFGEDFVSTGGIHTTKEFCANLNLKPNEKVLDVGAGIGGSAFYMAKTYGVEVYGFDLSTNMMDIALERAVKYNDKRVQFEVCDATVPVFGEHNFDVVYSRDTILHIADKLALFKNFFRYLRPGGRLLISDYCCREGEWSDDFSAYVKQRGYHLKSVKAYGELLEEAGFRSVIARDVTDIFVQSLHRELEATKKIEAVFVEECSRKDYDDIINGWNAKVKRCAAGDQVWGYFYADKPL